MNLPCLRERRLLHGVTVLELSTVDLPLAVAARDGLVGLAWAVPRVRRRLRRGPAEGATPSPIPDPEPFRFRAGDGPDAPVETVHGVVLSAQLSALLDFAERRYEPTPGSDRPLDLRVAELRRGALGRERFQAEVEAILQADARRLQPWRASGVLASPLLLGEPSQLGEDALWQERRILVAGPDDATVWTVAAPLPVRHSGVVLPREVFLLRHASHHVAAWDGHRYRVVRALRDVPPALLERLDRLGRAGVDEPGRYLPLPDLVPRFLLRVPGPEEAAGAGRPPRRTAAPAQPAFLVDARRAVPLPRGVTLPVIADPAAALEVLRRRSAHDVYLPGLPAAPLEDVALPEAGGEATWLVGCGLA